MSNIGIICDLTFDRHHLYKSYFYSVQNLYGDITEVKSADDLEGIEILFVGDDHYIPHKEILHKDGFIDRINVDGIKVVVFTNERIFDSHFPWNVDNYKKISTIKNLYHYTIDVDDCKKLGTKVWRTAPSISFLPFISSLYKNKIDAAVFIGKANRQCRSYNERSKILQTAVIPIVRHHPTISTWSKYMRMLSKYKFVFSPIGNGNFFTMRFYEALAVGSIPIHQVRKDTLKYYDIEATFKDCIFFEHPEEVEEKVKCFKEQNSKNVIWMEDWMKVELIDDGLL